MNSQEYQAAKELISSKREELRKAASDLVAGEIGKLFTQFPLLESISWTQYTPYFNDGDVCNFRSCHGYAETVPETGDFDDAVADTLSLFDDEDMEWAFGDHVRVTVTRNGVTTDTYDHD